MFAQSGCKISPQNRLRMNLFCSLSHLDPRKEVPPLGIAIIQSLFEGLTRPGISQTVIPAQAKTIWISKDQKTYTFQLEDLRWSNGERVTAQDFADTWRDLLSPSFDSPHAHLLYPIENAQEAKRGEKELSEVGIHVLDTNTLRVQLGFPCPSFLQLTSSYCLSPVHHLNEKKHPKWANRGKEHLGNGAYRVLEWTAEHLLLEKNPYYQGPTPLLPFIEIQFISDQSLAIEMYREETLDLIGFSRSILPSSLSGLKKDILSILVPATTCLFFNTTSPVFSNIHLRKAFSFCLDRKKILEKMNSFNEEIAHCMIPPGLKNGRSHSMEKSFDATTARRYLLKGLSELGIEKSSISLTLVLSAEESFLGEIAEALKEQWNTELGIEVAIKKLHSTDIDLETTPNSLSLVCWRADCCDPSAFVLPFLNPTSFRNYAQWDHAKIMPLCKSYFLKKTIEQKLNSLEKIEKLIFRETPLLPLFHHTVYFLKRNWLKNITISQLGQICFTPPLFFS